MICTIADIVGICSLIMLLYCLDEDKQVIGLFAVSILIISFLIRDFYG